MSNLMLFLFDIAYKTRCIIPIILSAGFMVLDTQVILEVEFEARIARGQVDREHEFEVED